MTELPEHKLPPLPELEAGWISQQALSQEMIDKAIRLIYERRPDLFAKLMERERTESDPDNRIADEISDYIRTEVRKDLELTNLNASTAIFWESRRRARLMAGLEI